jgi:hypothetical protein
MSRKNIEFKSHKAESLNEKKIRSSQYSKIKKSMADQLRGEIRLLIQKQDEAKAEAWKSVEEHERYKAKGKIYESEAEFHWLSYRTWSNEVHRLGEKIKVKLKAVQKFESPSKKMEEPKMIVDK